MYVRLFFYLLLQQALCGWVPRTWCGSENNFLFAEIFCSIQDIFIASTFTRRQIEGSLPKPRSGSKMMWRPQPSIAFCIDEISVMPPSNVLMLGWLNIEVCGLQHKACKIFPSSASFLQDYYRYSGDAGYKYLHTIACSNFYKSG
jgi:hypothetical protein